MAVVIVFGICCIRLRTVGMQGRPIADVPADDEVTALTRWAFTESEQQTTLEPLGLSRRYERFTGAQARHIASLRRLSNRSLASALQELGRSGQPSGYLPVKNSLSTELKEVPGGLPVDC